MTILRRRGTETYTTRIQREGRVDLPPGLSPFRLGQRVYFHVRDGEVVVQARPKRAVRGRILSSRVRSAVRSLAAYGPRNNAGTQRPGG